MTEGQLQFFGILLILMFVAIATIEGWTAARFRAIIQAHGGALDAQKQAFDAILGALRQQVDDQGKRIYELERSGLAGRLKERVETEKVLRPRNWRDTVKSIEELQNADRQKG